MKKVNDIIVGILVIALLSCNSVKKVSSSLKVKEDSVHVVKNETTIASTIDTSTKKKIDTSTSKIVTDDIEIFFENGNTDTAKEKPITITKKFGKTTIDAGNRKVKQVSQKSTAAATKTNKVEETKTAIATQNTNDNKVDSTHLIKDIEQNNNQKTTYRFSWWWLLMLVPIGFYSYYKFKK